jgi:hypothetical protein
VFIVKKPFLLIMLVGIIVAVAYLYSIGHAKTETASVMTLLRSEPMAFLVTRRIVTQIVVEESDVQWYSQSRSVLWATVNLHYGCNLEEIKPCDIRQTADGTWLIRLPPPKLLDFCIVSVDSISKDTFFAKAQDVLFATRTSRMMQQLQAAAVKFATDNNLLPSRQQIAADLNRMSHNSPINRSINLKFE